MLYIISGASRAGKTLVAQQLAAQKSISYFSLDWLVMGFTNGIPEYGVHDLLFPDEIAERSWSFIKAMLESMLYSDIDYIIEGEAILPELFTQLLEKHPNKLKICFLGFTNVDPNGKMSSVKKFSTGETDWLSDKTDAYILDHIKNMVAHSIKIEKSCAATGLTYFDTSKDFTATMERAISYLLDE
ncbi:hypothetical protein [uncultured Croceitalea sp.]|uniref:hypothetical protein n=1 Tax=uncultured Croceitalea sp. TaxID=1798908 RepID=UPI003305F073